MATTFLVDDSGRRGCPVGRLAGVVLTLPVIGLDIPPLTWGLEDRIVYDGAIAFRVRAEEQPISLSLLVDTDDMTMGQVARMFTPVLDVQSSVSVAGGTLTATTGGTTRTLENVIYESGLEGEISGSAGGGALPWRLLTAHLVALDPYWQGAINSQVLNIGAVTTFDAAVTFDSVTTPLDGGDSTQVAMPGDIYSFPMFVIDGPFTTLVLDGPQTGETIILAAPLAAGSQIVIDGTPGNRGPALNGGAIDWSLLTATSRIFPLVNPAATVSISATGTTGASRVEMRWRNRYLTAAA